MVRIVERRLSLDCFFNANKRVDDGGIAVRPAFKFGRCCAVATDAVLPAKAFAMVLLL